MAGATGDGAGLVTGHDHGGDLFEVVVAVLLGTLAVVGYLVGVRRSRVRLPWPWYRTACWLSGVVLLGVGASGPLAEAARHSFAAHAMTHVLVGMAGPLLLVCAAPATLALRALPLRHARLLSRVLGARPVRLLTEPLVAAGLNLGGLWLLYLSPLYSSAQTSPVVHVAVHLHLVAVGCLLTASLVGPDPMPHRRSYAHRAGVLVAVVAGHATLAKYLYAHPPAGVGVSAAETGAMVMYYGGDAVEIVVMVLLCRRWFAPRRTTALGPAAP